MATSHHCFTFRPDGSVYVPHFCRTLGPEACSLGTPLDIRFEERVAKCVASKPTAWSPTESADDVACGAGKVEEWQFWLVHSASWRCTCAMDAAVFFGHDFCHVHHLVAELFRNVQKVNVPFSGKTNIFSSAVSLTKKISLSLMWQR